MRGMGDADEGKWDRARGMEHDGREHIIVLGVVRFLGTTTGGSPHCPTGSCQKMLFRVYPVR